MLRYAVRHFQFQRTNIKQQLTVSKNVSRCKLVLFLCQMVNVWYLSFKLRCSYIMQDYRSGNTCNYY